MISIIGRGLNEREATIECEKNGLLSAEKRSRDVLNEEWCELQVTL